MFVREIRDGVAKARVLCVCVRDGSWEGEWKQELCVCEREGVFDGVVVRREKGKMCSANVT